MHRRENSKIFAADILPISESVGFRVRLGTDRYRLEPTLKVSEATPPNSGKKSETLTFAENLYLLVGASAAVLRLEETYFNNKLEIHFKVWQITYLSRLWLVESGHYKLLTIV